MSKFKIAILLITTICLLNACTSGGHSMEYSNYDKEADAQFEKIFNAIKDKDQDALKSMFSKKVIGESDDLDECIERLFEYFQGEFDLWESTGSYGLHGTQVSSYYYVNTDKQKYFFLIDDFTHDTNNPDNVGLYLLLVVKAEDEEKLWDGDYKIMYDGDKKLSPIGVYIPLE